MCSVNVCRKILKSVATFVIFVNVWLVGGSRAINHSDSHRTSDHIVPVVKEAQFSQPISFTLNSSQFYIYNFKYNFKLNETRVIRVHVNSTSTVNNDPVVFVFRQQKGIMSWQLPLQVRSSSSSKPVGADYYSVARTVCPLRNYEGINKDSEKMQDVYLDVSSESLKSVHVGLRLDFLENFVLYTGETLTFKTSPSEPQYFEYKFPANFDMIYLEMHSEDDLCMTISIQDIMCPVYDLNVNVEYTGYFQTVSRQSAFTIKKTQFPRGFVVVFIVKDTDNDCVSVKKTQLKVKKRHSGFNSDETRVKTVKMFVKERITKKKYQEATFGALVVYLMFYVFCIIVSCLYAIREWKNPKERNLLEPREATSLTDSGNAAPENQYGALSELQMLTINQRESSPLLTPAREAKALSSPIRQTTDRSPVSGESSSITTDTDEHSYVEPDVDMLDDAESEKDVFRTKTFLFVADLDRKPPKRTRKKSKMYHWNLLTIAVFYALPVIQLVFTYQRVSNITGNEDMCYYNFLCSYPQGSLSDFNHVYSNIGYILLGFLFLGLVWRRDLLYRRAVALNDRIEKYYGVPGYFGLFYTMGIALMMEGVLSGCYHVCPNYANFQFDTTFMYLIAWLCMLRIYQARHPDISPHAHTVYVVFASLIIVCVVGVLYGSIFFWILYAVVHVLSCLAVSAQIYYMGRWKMNFGIFKRIYLTLKNDLYTHFTRPMYMDRLVLLTVGNIINWSIALYGLIKQPKDFGSFLLSIFIVNLLLYTSFYIVMKIRHKEKILPLPLIYILLSAITWIAALYFFLQHDTSWKDAIYKITMQYEHQISPAESRNLNKPCMILDFYDDHDIWHFLSSSALFFGFMILLTLDDDLIYTPRDKIPVF